MASLGLLEAYGSGTSSEDEEEEGTPGDAGNKPEQKPDLPEQETEREVEHLVCHDATIRGSQGDEVDAAAAPTTSGRRCDPAVQAKVAKFLDLKRLHGRDLVEDIRGRKSFGNPDFLQKMVEHFGIDQYGSCYPRALYDYQGCDPGDEYDKIEEQVAKIEERRRADQLRQREEHDARAIAFQRAGFLGRGHQQQRQPDRPPGKRRRPSGWQ